jgi:prolipoprotein diacylglyceryl transferase
VICSVFAPLSIPSPPSSWAGFTVPLGEWLHWAGVPSAYALNIKTYALCILVGIVVAAWMTSHRLTKRGGEPGVVLDIALWAVVFGIIGARVYHVLTHYNDYFGPGKDWVHVFYVWEGGIAIFGALIGGAIGSYIGCRIAGIRFAAWADALAPALLLAQAFGRFGNYFNHELFGQPTSLPWGLQIESSNAAFPVGLPAGTLFQPTFLYEILWDLFGVAVIMLLERQYHYRWGKMLAMYFIVYGIGRVWFESIRIDPSEVFLGLRTNVWAALGAILLGLVIFVVQSRRHPGAEPGVYLPGRGWSARPSKLDSEETYSDSDESGDDAAHSPESAATSGAGTAVRTKAV